MYESNIKNNQSSRIPRQRMNHEHQAYLLQQRDLIIKDFKSLMGHRDNIQTLTYDDGSEYQGEIRYEKIYKNGRNNASMDQYTPHDQDQDVELMPIRQGFGLLSTADGSLYLGKFKNDIYHGQGIYLYPDGERYQGQIDNALKNGHGKMFYINGNMYEGKWVDDVKEGYGEMVYATLDGMKYIGQWRNGEPNGEGTLYSGKSVEVKGKSMLEQSTIKSNILARGTFVNGNLINGEINTSNYKGQYSQGLQNGQGTYIYSDGSSYQGQWKNGEKDGKGVFYFSNGDYYEGQFLNGFRHGKGIYQYSTGDRYQGEFKMDYKSGQGILILINGDEYRGEWSKDLFHGRGVYTFNGSAVGNRNNDNQIRGNFHYGQYRDEDDKLIMGQIGMSSKIGYNNNISQMRSNISNNVHNNNNPNISNINKSGFKNLANQNNNKLSHISSSVGNPYAKTPQSPIVNNSYLKIQKNYQSAIKSSSSASLGLMAMSGNNKSKIGQGGSASKKSFY